MEITINQKRMQGENSDRISNLPDSLVTRILSLLDAREVAQTCILSKRWRNVWSFVPSLLFDLTKFRGEEIRINNFVSSFLHLLNTACTIHTFKLHYQVPWTFDTEKSASIVRTWILYALEHKVRNLQIKFQATPSSCMHSIPECVFTCDSLEELQLELCDFILTDIVCLPKLRKLVLKNLVISKGAMKNLLSGCPSLKTLGFWCCEIKMRSISLQTVKSLSIVDFGFILVAKLHLCSLPRISDASSRLERFMGNTEG
ncbi:hypothetical protein LUZ61_017364 [Rhynchospora tenuis]|uniref:F-box domain-containing protein n=1 Tax=Rhynchospora tenuis TaxID=198213 RepID=A0AAD6EKY0_9POAL|nr:hypothetical protein LUZ61_017364 [Rhynchospora tenuis]